MPGINEAVLTGQRAADQVAALLTNTKREEALT